jgi:hypothetical protein
MSNAIQEVDDLMRVFSARIAILMDLFTVEATALAWKLAAEAMRAELPKQTVVGSLSWKGRPEKLSVAIPVLRKPGVDLGPPKVKIIGPKPIAKAKQFDELLGRRLGKWARRDGKVSYTCVSGDSKSVFVKIKRTDNNEIKKVKFASMVRDWIYIQ